MAAVIPDLMSTIPDRKKEKKEGKGKGQNDEKAHFMRKTRAYPEDTPSRFSHMLTGSSSQQYLPPIAQDRWSTIIGYSETAYKACMKY